MKNHILISSTPFLIFTSGEDESWRENPMRYLHIILHRDAEVSGGDTSDCITRTARQTTRMVLHNSRHNTIQRFFKPYARICSSLFDILAAVPSIVNTLKFCISTVGEGFTLNAFAVSFSISLSSLRNSGFTFQACKRTSCSSFSDSSYRYCGLYLPV